MDPNESRQLNERMDALSGAIASLVKRMQALENHVASLAPNQQIQQQPLEQQTYTPVPEYQAPPPVEYQAQAPSEYQAPPQFQFTPEPAQNYYQAEPVAPAQSPNFESKVGLAWANWVGVVTLFFAVAFGFKYMVDNEWIGETGRVVLGVIAGLATIFGGDIFWNRGQKVFGQGIAALGVSVLYISFYASFGYYHLVPVQAAFVLMALTTVIGTLLAIRYNSVALSTLSQIGGYLTPLSLSTGQDAPITLFSYITMLNVGAIALGRRQGWRLPGLFAIIASSLIFTGWYADKFRPEKAIVATVFTFFNYAIFVLGGNAFLSGAGQVLGALGLAALWQKDPRTGAFLLLAITSIGGLFAGALRRVSLVAAAFFSFWFAYAVNLDQINFQLYVGEFFEVITVAFLGFLGWIYWWVRSAGYPAGKTVLTILSLDGIAYFAFGYALLEKQYASLGGLFAVFTAAVYITIGWMLWNTTAENRAQIRNGALITAVMALSFLTMAVPIQFSAWRITLAWAMEAVALAYIAKRVDAPRLYWLSTFMLVLVGFRVLGEDAQTLRQPSEYMLLFNTRFFILTWSAAAFWLTAKFFRRGAGAAAIYIIGHVIFWGALALEVSGWVYRTTLQSNEAFNYDLIGQSILLGAYGLSLIAIGVATRTALNRILGLTALGMVVLKLYLVDVWQLNQAFKILAFLGLGVLLVATSYVYSRFRDKIAKIWKDDAPAT